MFDRRHRAPTARSTTPGRILAVLLVCGLASGPALAAGETEAYGTEAEGLEAGTLDFTSDNPAYLTRLGLIRGRLAMAMQLIAAERPEEAAAVMIDSEHRLYAELDTALDTRDVPKFGPQLDQMSELVNQGASAPRIQAAYVALLQAISSAQSVIPRLALIEPAVISDVVIGLAKAASTTYRRAVSGGEVGDARAYHAGMGYIQEAMRTTYALDLQTEEASAAAIAEIAGAIENMLAAWPSLAPPETATIPPTRVDSLFQAIRTASEPLTVDLRYEPN